MFSARAISIGALFLAALSSMAATLTVGAGKEYSRIEEALAASQSGDRIEIYPASGNGIYLVPAIYVTKSNLTFVGMEGRPILDGTGFNYSGIGSTPRAIFQINQGANGVTIENLELRGAHNDSHNGAGVRINQGNQAVIRRCTIHNNDMGIMSNGNGSDPSSASGQMIEFCSIYFNGDISNPGFNHNLYLGGSDATVRFCDIHDSLTGHNLKSRAHFNLLQYNFIHDSANRELDLVDAWDTSRQNSHAVLMGNLIVKKLNMSGNRGVIHFGQDGSGHHDGTLYLLNNTIVTSYVSDVVQLSTAPSAAVIINNVIFNGSQSFPSLFSLASGLQPSAVSGDHNWISSGYSLQGSMIDPGSRYQGSAIGSDPGFQNLARGQFFLAKTSERYGVNSAPQFLDGAGVNLSAIPAFQYRPVASRTPIGWAPRMYLGAGIQRPVGQGGH